jgi:hypothetical protein
MEQPKNSLSTIALDSLALDQLLFESNGEITPELEAWMQEISTNLATKVDALAFVLQNLDNRQKQLKEKAEQYKEMQKRFEAAEKRLREYIQQNITLLGSDSVEGSDYKFSLRETPGRLEVNEEELLACYKMPVTTVVPDKERIKYDLLEGRLVPGAKLIKTKTIQMRMKGPRR